MFVGVNMFFTEFKRNLVQSVNAAADQKLTCSVDETHLPAPH